MDFGRLTRASPALGRLVRQYREHLTTRGRYLLWATAAFAVIGIDTRRTQVYELFAVSFALLLVALLYALLRRPRLVLEGRIPKRLTAGRALTLPLRVRSTGEKPVSDVLVAWPRPPGAGSAPSAHPRERFIGVAPDRPTTVSLEVRPPKRGRYELLGVSAQITDPLRAVAIGNATPSDKFS